MRTWSLVNSAEWVPLCRHGLTTATGTDTEAALGHESSRRATTEDDDGARSDDEMVDDAPIEVAQHMKEAELAHAWNAEVCV